MRVLLVWPPSVPMYFNAAHHLPLWAVASYLRAGLRGSVKALDAGVLNCTWAEVARLLTNRYDVVGILNEFETVSGVGLLIAYCRALWPHSRIVTFGRASSVIPAFFERYRPDAIVASGDWETGVAQFVELCSGARKPEDVHGLLLRQNGGFRDTGPGVLLPPEQWADPDPAEVPWDDYNRIYASRQLKTSGLAGMREFSVTVGKGCPLGCAFCTIPGYQGRKDRRRSVSSVLACVDEARPSYAFDYVSLFAPTLTLRRDWVLDFCSALLNHPRRYLWKSCTTLQDLDEELVRAMGAAGCLRLSVGLETLDPGAIGSLPPRKRATEDRLRKVARWTVESGIELNCLIMLGMPGQTCEGVEYTLRVVRESGAMCRSMMFTRYDNLSPDMDEHALTMHCRQVIEEPLDEKTLRQFYSLHFAPVGEPE